MLLIILYSESHCLYKINDFSPETCNDQRTEYSLQVLVSTKQRPRTGSPRCPICRQFPRAGKRPRVNTAPTPHRLTAHPAAPLLRPPPTTTGGSIKLHLLRQQGQPGYPLIGSIKSKSSSRIEITSPINSQKHRVNPHKEPAAPVAGVGSACGRAYSVGFFNILSFCDTLKRIYSLNRRDPFTKPNTCCRISLFRTGHAQLPCPENGRPRVPLPSSIFVDLSKVN